MLKKVAFLVSLLTLLYATAFAQITASIKGNVTDSTGAAVAGAKVTVTSPASGIVRTTNTGSTGDYEVPALPPGDYTVKIEGGGFQPEQAEHVRIEVSQNIVQNFTMRPATAATTVTVEGAAPIIDSTTMTVGQVIDQRVVQEFPLNGRHFVDLALLVPGSVTPPQNGFLTAPLRGQGSFAVNSAGMREDQVNWTINGINLSDMVQNQITFQPVISTVGEFKVDNSTYSADYGRNAGAIVTIASRSGTNQFHGELYEYLRNDFFDARNAFNRSFSSTGTPLRENEFRRNQFGGDFGGPIWKDKTFFFATYEGERQRQGLALSTNVFPDGAANPTVASCEVKGAAVTRNCIAAVGNPVSNALLGLIPHANTTIGKSAVANAFIGSATAPVNIDQGTIDINHNFSADDRLHGYYVYQHDLRQEAGAGTDLPGFGDTREGHRQVFTLGETHVFTSSLINEVNLGYNRIHLVFAPDTAVSPSSLGLSNTLGANELFMPTILDQQNGILFGAERGFPQGRGDTTASVNDNLSWIKGRHSLKFGFEFRDFRNNNFNGDPGQLIFNTDADFMNGLVDSSARTVGSVADRITQNSLDFYAMDSFRWKTYFTWELGIRYSWNKTPTEADGRFFDFVPGGAMGSTLVQTNTPYQQNDRDFAPRVGFAWDLFHDGKTVLRSGYALQYDEPITGLVTGLASNPPFALPISFATPTPFAGLPAVFGGIPASLSPTFVDPNFTNPYVQSWNVNIQQELTGKTSFMVGYFGNKGTHLEDDINANQTAVLGKVAPGNINPMKNNMALPFQLLSPNNPIRQGTAIPLSPLILEHTSGSNSNYNAFWATATHKTSHHLQFNLSYTYSHAIDEISRDEAGTPVLLNSNNIFLARASSDFDVRNRFVGNAIYDLPGNPNNRLLGGWQIAPIVTLQSGSPFNIVVNNSSGIIGASNTITPNASAPLQISGNPLGQWIANPLVLSLPGNNFGTLGRNSVTGPNFLNLDFSLAKNTKITERMTLQIRCDAFDLFNHPNYGNPGPQSGTFLNAVLTPGASQTTTFSTINATRFPTGDFGSSRQLQLAAKLTF